MPDHGKSHRKMKQGKRTENDTGKGGSLLYGDTGNSSNEEK